MHTKVKKSTFSETATKTHHGKRGRCKGDTEHVGAIGRGLALVRILALVAGNRGDVDCLRQSNLDALILKTSV